MKLITGRIEELYTSSPGSLENALAAAKINLVEKVSYHTGQYFQVRLQGENNLLPRVAFVVSLPDQDGLFLDEIPTSWLPGKYLQIWGPLGKGFSIPGSAVHVSFVIPNGDPIRILQLMYLLLKQHISISVFVDHIEDVQLSRFPLEVEIQPLAAFPETIHWTDFSYFDLDSHQLDWLKTFLGRKFPIKPAVIAGEVLVRTKMPCLGIANCQVCAIETRRGIRLVCKDGPVFKLEDFIHVV